MERLAITNIAHHHKNNLIAIIAAFAIIQSYRANRDDRGDGEMKTASEIYRQHGRISARIFLVARMFAKRAHPETGGNDMLCHNWGNEESRKVWGRAYKRMDKARAIYQRMYSLAEHAQHHDAKFCPLWCEHCQPSPSGR